MIQSFADKYKKLIAYPLFVIFYLQTIVLPLHAAIHNNIPVFTGYGKNFVTGNSNRNASANYEPITFTAAKNKRNTTPAVNLMAMGSLDKKTVEKGNIGGPSSPEATSFKAVGSDNLVNLFTGDFSYSIPLLDVGGYPVNLFYSGGISMEQEASWVGLGWNINPGTVSRNMRGVPDDFNGEDKLKQTQNVKPNRTWGGEVGIDGEVIGIKQPKINLSLGFSYNNYLGPALELGAGVSLNIPIIESIKPEKEAAKADTGFGLSASVGLNAKLNSRSGLTFSPSLNAGLQLKNQKDNIGVGISTSYNSRTGIKDINLSMSTSHYSKDKDNKKDHGNSTSGSIGSSSITFARPSYMPTLRMPMQYANYSGQLEFGGGMFGLRGAAHAQGYYSESKVPVESRVVYKPLVGFIYSEKANGNKDAVMDFNRLNDAEVTPRTPILSAPQYAYDIFSIQGEGTGGSIRAYRGDLGFMRDNETMSKDNNISLGFDIAPAGHYGGNWNIIHTPTRVGGWEDANNTLHQTLAFRGKSTSATTDFENVYFRNPGEATVTNPELLTRIGGDNLVRFKLSGSDVNPRLESRLELFNKNTLAGKGELGLVQQLQKRDKRTQVTTMLTAKEASVIGLEKTIRNYTGNFKLDTTIDFTSIGRTEGFRKAHHISEIDVLEQTGMRYVYGLPVYSIKQKDYTFSVNAVGNPSTGITTFSGNETDINSPHMENKAKLDGYVITQETPAYASSFLLTGLLSPDYVDVTGNGITEDDLGGAVKFDYNKSAEPHKWRTPRDNTIPNTAHFNEGLKSEKKDNKATISYGEREVWYLNAIESKSMVAIFKTGSRNDAKGVMSETDGTINTAENANKKLDRIDLYTKAEIRAKGIAKARPIKTVHFDYAYTLCKGTRDNNTNGGGKLTLRSVYFSYNGQSRVNKDRYVFNYGDSTDAKDNPVYANNASDKWGTYKNPNATDSAANPGGLSNADYPYTSGNKTKNDEYAAAWSLKKILLPSGGQMEIQYEADDYAYVQNKRACNMFNIFGLGSSTNSSTNNGLYNLGLPFPFNAGTSTDNFYVYVKLSKALQNTDPVKQKQEILDKYLEGVNQLAFKLLIDMPKGPEALTVYANYDDYGLCTNSTGRDIIYIKLHAVDGKSPLSKSAIGFITENLPGQAFEGYEVEVDGVKAFVQMVGGMLKSIKDAFKNVDEQMRSYGKARMLELDKSFVRLDNPEKTKYGGGVRVKKVIVKDNWQKMLTGNGATTYGFTSTYGQEYDYTTTEKINGIETTISSGVASYEPGLGSEENPFREIVAFSNKMPLASAQYGAIEMPMLEGLYPSPGVGYSKVTVRSIHRKGTHGDSSLRSAIGKQVTEFYTAKEFPVYSVYTPMNSRDFHRNSFFNLLYKDITDRKVTSQGFLVETNDMHGKMKSQIAYSESDEKTPLSYSYHTYKNTGKNGLNDVVDFVDNAQGGAVVKRNMGIDMELMTDVREFRVQSSGFNGQIQTDFFTFVPFPFFIIPMLPIKTYTENKYRAVTCTKLINYHAIEDSVIVMDKGSVISTKAIAYDAETGTAIVTKTANEFNDPIYNVNYPAYWAYSGMSLAYKNIDRQLTGINFYEGKIQNLANQNDIFESGDELYVSKQENLPPPVTPSSVTGTVSYACSATNNGQGEVTLSFNFVSPTPANLKLNVGWVYQNNFGYGSAGVTLPSYAVPQDPGPYYIDVPAGVTSYSTPFPNLNSAGQFWPCYDGLPNLQYIYKKAFVLKVASPANYVSNLVCNTPGLIFQNDISNVPPPQQVCVTSSADVTRLWAYDTTKNSTALTVPDKHLVFLDSAGNLFTKGNVSLRIIRSGKRNLLGNSVASATTMENPIASNILNVSSGNKTVAASAMEFKEKWQTDNEVFKRYKTVVVTTTPPELVVNGDFSAGNYGFTSGFGYYASCNFPPWQNYNICSAGAPHGNTMGFNGAALIAWQEQNLPVTPNTTYTFSAAFYNVNNAQATIQVYVNNIAISSIFALPANGWNTYTFTWNSGSSTTASIVIRDHNGNQNGNDFAIDDISFKAAPGCYSVEVEDCGGHLEKSVNPYVKGLMGNYKGYRSMVYYGDRVSVPVTPNATNIRSNGYLAGFSTYWNFNGSSNLVPDVNNSKWVWNSQNMKYNSKGLELETKDALNIYTAAEYGFNKTQPVAVAKNSRYSEMFGESFEDKGYNESINLPILNACTKAHMDFNGIEHASIVPSFGGINAHTGNTMLKVDNNSQAVKTINFTANDDSFELKPLTVTQPGPQIDYGFLVQGTTTEGSTTTNVNYGTPGDFNNIDWSFGYSPNYLPGFGNPNTSGSADVNLNAYFDVVRDGTYQVQSNDTFNITGTWWYPGGTDCSPSEYHEPNGSVQISLIKFQVFDASNNLVYDNVDPHASIYLDKGIYFIKKHVMCSYQVESSFWNTVQSCTGSAGDYGSAVGTNIYISFSHNLLKLCPNDKISKYKSLATGSSCTITKPIPVQQSMINPVFSPMPGKKMLFSAWVRENCGNGAAPCLLQTYNNSSVNISFSDGSSIVAPLLPKGAIIEGWQKVEGEFTVPANATAMTLQLINAGSTPNFWDDIRMHPFNANMKTYAYDPRTLRLAAELDENNYASFYEYDEEGQLVRVKKETSQGVKTINETRASKQKGITDLQ